LLEFYTPFTILKIEIDYSYEKNYNYYDDKKLFSFLKPYLLVSLKKQIEFGANRHVVICLGKKNGEYLKILNGELNLFNQIEILDHPRYIMQYRKKKMDGYLEQYIATFKKALNQ